MRALTFFRAAGAVLLAGSAPLTLAAQIDYRNTDDDRPARVEDAYPLERYAFELLLPYAYERERSGEHIHAWVLELAYGALPNLHVGVKAPIAAVRAAGVTESGLSGLRAFLLYNLNTESPSLPALSVRADVQLPAGALGGDETRFAVKAIATRSWGRTRVHVNAAYGAGPDGALPAVEALDRWWYGAALDRTLFRQSLLVIGEVYARRLQDGAPVEVNAGLGIRWQWRPTAVLDLGVTRRLRDTGADYAVTIGLSKAFAVRGFMP
ncbi:MAG: hypothetical protein ACREMJ_11040 [Gemmatimonadales bacterium]